MTTDRPQPPGCRTAINQAPAQPAAWLMAVVQDSLAQLAYCCDSGTDVRR